MAHGESKAKRKLDMNDVNDVAAKKAPKRGLSTAIEITQFASKKDAIGKDAQGSKQRRKSGKIDNCNKKKANKSKQNKASQGNSSDTGAEANSDNNNAIPEQLDRIEANMVLNSQTKKQKAKQSNKTPINIGKGVEIPSTSVMEGDQNVVNPFDNSQYDCIDLDINAPAHDDFTDSDDSDCKSLKIHPRNEEEENIPPEVIEKLKSHPIMVKYIGEVVDKRISHRESELRTQNPQGKHMNKQMNMTKSPSDTTIYRLGLNRESVKESNEIINRISNFVEDIRIGASKGGTPVDDHRKTRPIEPSTSHEDDKDLADKIVLDVERSKARIQPPKGRSSLEFHKFMQNSDDDDEFFHVTCHIDKNLRGKIAHGEFVDLEKLLPKDRAGVGSIVTNHDENRVELVSRDGHTYFKPIRDTQINGLRKWEQAFRIYAAIYTDANPERSGKIWQYMHCINVAASSYQWENVASYDLTFRQLMAFKPHRSWAKTYTQGWNLALRDPIGKASGQNYAKNVPTSAFQTNKQHDWHDDCCWRFNRNRCKSHDCQYDHHCTYCGGWNHGFYDCRKCLKKDG